MKTLTVLSPVFKEEAVIEAFYAELRKVLTGLQDRYQSKMLFVVDPSPDSTLEILRGLAQNDKSLQVLHLSSRFGHQMALLAGIDHCKSDALIMMDCDLQHPPQLIPELLKEFEKGYDIVYTIRKDRAEIGFWKNFTSKLFYRMINRISEIPISESAADFRLISARIVKIFQDQIRERNQFLRGLFNWVGFKSTTIHFQAGKRSAGKSKYSLGRMIRFGMNGIVSFSKKPLQATILLGFIFASFGILHAIFSFIIYFYYSSLPSGWTTLTILISMFSGVQLISLGIIGEYIGAIFDEVKGRPHYIIQEKLNLDDE